MLQSSDSISVYFFIFLVHSLARIKCNFSAPRRASALRGSLQSGKQPNCDTLLSAKLYFASLPRFVASTVYLCWLEVNDILQICNMEGHIYI